MNKKFLLAGLAFAGLFAACKKVGTPAPNNTTTDQTSISIVGKWTYVKDSVNFYKNGQFSSAQVEPYTNEYMQFNKDGTGSNAETTFTYKVDGKTLSLNFAAYTAGGVNHDADQEIASIQELSAHKLYLYYDFIATGNNSVYSTLSR